MYIQQKLKKVLGFIDHFEQSTGTATEDELATLSELEQLIGENPSLIKYQSILLYNAGYTKEVIQYLTASLNKFQRNYELYTLLYELLHATSDTKRIFYTLSQMFKLAENEQVREEVSNRLEDTVLRLKMSQEDFSHFFEYFKAESTSSDYRFFPINEYGNSVIRQDAFPGRDSNNSYLVNMHKTVQKLDVNNNDRFYFLYETIKGSFVKANTNLPAKKGDIIAISSASKASNYTNLSIQNLEEEVYQLKIEPNLIKYLKVKQNKDVIIETDHDIFVSHFKKNILVNKPKLVLQIFIDGLSFQFVKNNGFEQLMPNTYEFFKTGYINNNCHANGEWTLPSLMSMCTGKYTTNHYVYHTEAPHKAEVLNKFIHEYFEEAGYMTGRICSNWRGTPSYGYFKANNRSVYAPMNDRMNCDEIVTETLEHMEAFKDFYNYVWMTVEDLHGVADGLARGILQDVNTLQFVNENVEEDSDISVFRTFNEKKIEEYKSAIRKVDFYLGFVFDYIKKNYNPNDFVVTINSDHGQKFIEEENYMFTQKRTNVPFMMKGRNVIAKSSDELMSNVDIFPTLLNTCGLQCDERIDGGLLKDFGGEGRAYTVTESIFPGQTYKLALNDIEHLFTFETKENTRNDGLIPINEYSIKLKNRVNGLDETDKYPEKVELYCQETFEHIKEWIYFGA